MNFNELCLHFGSQNPSKKMIPLDLFSTFSQDTSKMPQDASKTPPRRFSGPPRSLQDASKTPQDAPRQPKDASKLPQVALKHPPKCYKIETFEKSLNFHCVSSDFSSFFIFSGFPWRGKGQTPLSKQLICLKNALAAY